MTPYRWLVSFQAQYPDGRVGWGNNWMDTGCSPPLYEHVVEFQRREALKLGVGVSLVVIAISQLSKGDS